MASVLRDRGTSTKLRVYIRGPAEALLPKLASDPHIELVDRIESAEAVVSLPPTARDPDDARQRGRDEETPVESLTPREHGVLVLVADGLLNRDIASRLGISEHTVKFHLASIFGKLGVATRTEAVQRGLRLGIIDI